MSDLLHILDVNEIWIYLLLGVVGLVYFRKVLIALNEWRGSLFGLERNTAQRRLTEATSILVLLLMMMGGEFILVTFVIPNYPNTQPLPTPTLDWVSATATPAADQTLVPPYPVTVATVPAAISASAPSNCSRGQIEFTYPRAGDQLKGLVTLTGSANIPNFGFYKYEFAQPGSSSWTTIQAGTAIRMGCTDGPCPTPTGNPDTTTETDRPDQIGQWDTSQLVPGDYLLQLIVTDNQGNALPACIIPVRVLPAQ